MKPLTSYQRILIKETFLGFAVSFTMTGIMSWIIYHRYSVIPMWGTQGFVADMFISTFIPVLAMFIAISLLTRRRVGSGQLSHKMQSDSRNGLFSALPDVLILQSVFFAIALAITCAVLSAVVVLMTGMTRIKFLPFMIVNVVLGGAVGLAAAPFTVIMCLANISRRKVPI